MADWKRLDETDGANVHTHDGKVCVSMWLEGRKPDVDPMRVEMKPGAALTMAADLIKAARDALVGTLGARIR